MCAHRSREGTRELSVTCGDSSFALRQDGRGFVEGGGGLEDARRTEETTLTAHHHIRSTLFCKTK